MTDRELMQQALDTLEFDSFYGTGKQEAITALRERLAQPEQEFTTHEEGEDGWSDWVCPDPQSYLMKCCDCGLVHEAQFGVVRYKSEAEREDCEKVDDPNLQAVFRMRRSEEWTPDDTAYRPGGLAQPEQYEQAVTDALVGGTGVVLGGERIDPAGIYKQPEQEPVALETVYETIIQWDEGGGKRSRRELARRIVALYATPQPNTKANSEAIPEQISEPEQEPVANGWSVFNTAVEVWSGLSFADAVAELSPERMERGWSAVCVINKDNPPLYTTPPRREWVGLDRKEMLSIIDQQGAHKATGLPMFYRDQCLDMLRAIEAKLREKNA